MLNNLNTLYFQRISILCLLLLFVPFLLLAQNVFEAVDYKLDESLLYRNEEIIGFYALNIDVLHQNLTDSNNPIISIDIKGKTENLLLEKTNILSPDYKLFSAKGKIYDRSKNFLFYQGKVANQEKSKVCLTIVDNILNLSIHSKKGNVIIHHLENNLYVAYYEEEVVSKLQENWDCVLIELSEEQKLDQEQNSNKRINSSECISIFLEIDHNMYNKKGGNIANTESWALTLMNQVAILYMEHDVPINVSGIQVWDTIDPYISATNTSQALNLFRTEVQNNPNFNGRLAHLLSGRSLGGGIAYLSVLCSNFNNVAVSANLNGGAVSFPTYSWNVMVIAHELGHNVGSNHTHACVWNGDNTAIDGCYTTEGSCPQPPIPPASVGGTIMSYCHLTSSGINFLNGFGPQPGALLKERYLNAACETGSNCAIVAPYNDVCARSKEIPVLNYCIEGIYSNIGCSASGETPSISCGTLGEEKDIWFHFTYPDVDSVHMELKGLSGSSDWVAEIYSGNCNTLVAISCDTTNSSLLKISLSDPSFVNEKLKIRIVEKGSDEEGTFSVCVYSTELACQNLLDTILTFYDQMDGANWYNKTGWNEGSQGIACDYCNWFGVSCDYQGNIISIDLNSNNLNGAFYTDLVSFPKLNSIDFHDNELFDTLPNTWELFQGLRYLNLSDNNISGTIPQSFAYMSKIQSIHLDNNNLNGNIPTGLGYNGSLRNFTASNNQLEGCFAQGLRNLCSRDSLDFSNNADLPDNGNVSLFCSDNYGSDDDNDGYCRDINDCNDYDPNINEGMIEVLCDNIDNNCDGTVDEGSDFGPNTWIGLDSLGVWNSPSSWSLGHTPMACEIVEIGMNGDQIHLELSSAQYTPIDLRALKIGEQASLVIGENVYFNIVGTGNIENYGNLIVSGGVYVSNQYGSNQAGIYNEGMIWVQDQSNLSINSVGLYGLHNTVGGFIQIDGYSDVGNHELGLPETAIYNQGYILLNGQLTIWGGLFTHDIKLAPSGVFDIDVNANFSIY